jgi:hypothetical protein
MEKLLKPSCPYDGPIYHIPTPKCTSRPLKYHPNAVEEGDRIFCIQTLPTDTPESLEANATGSISQRLAEKSWEGGCNSEWFEDIAPKPYQEFVDVFSKESFDQLLERKPWDHAIELTPDAKFFNTIVYPMLPVKQKELDAFLDENLKTHWIRPSKSPMASHSTEILLYKANIAMGYGYLMISIPPLLCLCVVWWIF